MTHTRLVVGSTCLLLSILGVFLIGFLEIMNMDSWLVQVSDCLPSSCRLQLQSTCLQCSHRKSEGDLLLSRQKRQENGCEQVVGCLYMCGEELVNTCHDQEEMLEDQNYLVCEDIEEVEVMGHAGGDPASECENTVEATVEGVMKGMDSVHIDLSISKDGIPFLWRDHDPRTLSARLRQMGVWGVAKCRPVVARDMEVPANVIFWHQVRSSWHYTSEHGEREIITYQEWLEEVAEFSSDFKSIWLEFRVPSSVLVSMVKTVWEITVAAGLEDKLYFKMDYSGQLVMKRNIVFVKGIDVDVNGMSAVQRDEVEKLVKSQEEWFTRDDEDYLLLAMLKTQLGDESKNSKENVGFDLSRNGYQVMEMENVENSVKELVMSRDLVTTDQCAKDYTLVAVSTINTKDMMMSMMCQGVDLMLTDLPNMLSIMPFCSRKEECPMVCGRTYSPVCGSDLMTYSSQCSLELYSCMAGIKLWVIHEGKCGAGR